MSDQPFRGFRVAIVGSCQAPGLRAAFERYLPGCHVDSWHINRTPDDSPDKIAPRAAGADLVITQLQPGNNGLLEIDLLRARHARVVFLPLVVFTGFHPDTTFCLTTGSAPHQIGGALYSLQSEIILAAYHLGLPERRVATLFNSLVFDALGYLTIFESAKTAFLNVSLEQGYDLTEAFDDWMREGCFMYSDNHPHQRVLCTLARLAIEKAGLSATDVPSDEPWPDSLSGSIRWPVYPAIARRIGIEGSTDFVRSLYFVQDAKDRTLSLDAFISSSYQVLHEAAANGGIEFLNSTLEAAEKLRALLDTRGGSALEPAI